MSLPTINTYHVDTEAFHLYWKASPASTIKKWNLYGAESVTIDFNLANGILLPGSFTLIQEGIPNHQHELTPGSVYTKVLRSDLGLSGYDSYFFLITGLDADNIETPMEVDNVHACPFFDQNFVDESGWPCNIVYGNFEFNLPVGDWDLNRFLDIISLIGRPSKEVKIHTDQDIQVRFNYFKTYGITVKSGDPFDLKRGELQVDRLYFKNASGSTAAVRLFAAG